MIESGSHISYTKTLEEQTLVYLSFSPPNLSMMLVWNNLADPHLSAFSDFAWFSQTVTLKHILVFFITGVREKGKYGIFTINLHVSIVVVFSFLFAR